MHPNPDTRRMMIERLVARCGPNNRPGLERHVDVDTNNWELLSIKSWAQAVLKADHVLDDKPFLSVDADDCQKVMKAFRTIYTRSSLRLKAISFRKHLRFLHGVEKTLAELGKAGAAIERTLKVVRDKNADKAPDGQVIADPDFIELIDKVPSRLACGKKWNMQDRDRCMWQVDRHAGFRVGELVSLNKRYATREVHDGAPCYRLDLVEAKDRTDGYKPDLKTGKRTVYVANPAAVLALDVWLANHPSTDPDAPLFIVGEGCADVRRLCDDAVRKTLRKCMKAAGLNAKYPGFTPHDFRHTCATEKAELGWGEYQMCSFFGWEIGSPTPGTYVHGRVEKQRARILADATKQAQAAVQAAPAAGEAVNALMGLLKQAMAQMSPEGAPRGGQAT